MFKKQKFYVAAVVLSLGFAYTASAFNTASVAVLPPDDGGGLGCTSIPKDNNGKCTATPGKPLDTYCADATDCKDCKK